ncbi:MAG TPA: amidohydrolase family protein, partial [Actinomycetota bacterium]|nr:amidohydrolase family protein [Actinomycetota bacterium]
MRTLYRASRVHAPTHSGEWVLVDERHVERVGSGEPPAADQVVDLPGTTIVPGFIDAHVHLTGTGMSLDGLDLSGVGSKEEMLEAARRHLAERPGPLFAQGFDETTWPRPELPSASELDAISAEPMLLVRVDGYLSVANRATIDSARAGEHPGLETGRDGSPTGVLRDRANATAQLWHVESLSDLDIRDAQMRAGQLAASRGVTSVHEMSIPDKRGMRDAEVMLAMRQDLPIEVVPYIAMTDIPFVID